MYIILYLNSMDIGTNKLINIKPTLMVINFRLANWYT